MENESSILAITIDFAKSHTFFPMIVTGFLLILVTLIFFLNGIPYLRALQKGDRTLHLSSAHIDKIKLIGTLVLTVAYFLLMDYVGSFFPNTGYGFLIVTMPFMCLLSLLYVHNLDRKKFVTILLNSTIAPTLSWVLLGHMLKITLP